MSLRKTLKSSFNKNKSKVYASEIEKNFDSDEEGEASKDLQPKVLFPNLNDLKASIFQSPKPDDTLFGLQNSIDNISVVPESSVEDISPNNIMRADEDDHSVKVIPVFSKKLMDPKDFLFKVSGPPISSSNDTLVGPSIHGSVSDSIFDDNQSIISNTTSVRRRPPPKGLPPLMNKNVGVPLSVGTPSLSSSLIVDFDDEQDVNNNVRSNKRRHRDRRRRGFDSNKGASNEQDSHNDQNDNRNDDNNELKISDNQIEFVSNRRRRYRLDKIEKLENKTSGPGIKNSSKTSSKKIISNSRDLLANADLKLPSLNSSLSSNPNNLQQLSPEKKDTSMYPLYY
jgi:hypothetical protein